MMKCEEAAGGIREQLLERLGYLQQVLNGSATRLKEGSESQADPLDRATTEHDRAVELTIRLRNSQEVKDIEEALCRIDKGQFGICTRCGGVIAPRRLMLAPMTRMCAACKNEIEMERKTHIRMTGARSPMGARSLFSEEYFELS